MKNSDNRKLGPKTRQLRFETMEERLYLSVTPCSDHVDETQIHSQSFLYSDPTLEYLGECSAQCVSNWTRPDSNNSFKTPLTIEWENGEWKYDPSEMYAYTQAVVREDGGLAWKHEGAIPQDWDYQHQCYWHYLQMKDTNNEYPDINQIVFGPNYDVPLNQNPDYAAAEYALPSTYQSIAGEYENFTHLDEVREKFGLIGTNQTIVVIDTGLDLNHAAFQNADGSSKIVGWYDFSNPDATDLTDINGNGTHTAAIIGSVDSNHLGVAPGADLVMLKVGGDDIDDRYRKDTISSDAVAQALQWVIDHKDDPQFADNPITVVNISLNPGNLVNLVREKMQILRDAGICVSIMGRDATSVDSFGPEGDPSTFFGGDYGRRYPGQLLAPGERIVSAIPNGGYDEKTGTGVATAYMSGAYALVYEALLSMKGEIVLREYAVSEVQEQIYNLLKINSDSAWSVEDYRNYDRLNLMHTIQNILGKDTVGDTASTAQEIHGSYYYDGVINHVGDTDYFTHKVYQSGVLTISRTFVHDNTADRAVWLDTEGNELSGNADGSLTLFVEAGKTYTFGLRSESVGKYSLRLNVEKEQALPQVNVKTVQNGTVSPNGEEQQHIIFEFERIIEPGRPDKLNEPLTVAYEVWLTQDCETGYRNSIADFLNKNKTLTLVFQPGETTIQMEFSGFGYNEYKSNMSLSVDLLGTIGEMISQNPSATAHVNLVNNPGEQSIPVVSVKAVPGPSHDGLHSEKILVEFERQVDPNDPHALDEPLEIFYTDDCGPYSYLADGYRGRFSYAVYKYPTKLVFQPGESNIVLELTRPGPSQWMSITISEPVGGIYGFDANSWSQPNQVNTFNDYFVEQGYVELDFETPCSNAETAPTLHVTAIQDAVVDAQGNIVQNPVFEFERKFDPSDCDALNERLTVNFTFQGSVYDPDHIIFYLRPQVLGNYSIQFQPGETTVRFEYDIRELLDSELDIRNVFCALGTSTTGVVFEEAAHYHVGTRFAKLTIHEEISGAETAPITAPTYEVSGPTEEELFEKMPGWWDFSAETSRERPIMDWEINWGDGSENTRILGGPRNHVRVPHHYQNAGKYAITLKTTDLLGHETTITIGSYTVKERVVEQEQSLQVNVKTIPQDVPSTISEELVIQAEASASIEAVADHFTTWTYSRSTTVEKIQPMLGIAEINMFYRLEKHENGDLNFSDFTHYGSSSETETLWQTAADSVLSDWNTSGLLFDLSDPLLDDEIMG